MEDKYVNPNGISALKQWVMQKIRDNSGNSTAFASMFELGLSDTYHIENDSDAANTISNALNLNGFNVAIGTSGIKWKKPTVVIPDITWSDSVDDNYDYTALCNVKVQFGDAGTVSKTVTFKKPGRGKIYAVKPMDGACIDTGIAADYSMRFHAKGHTQQGNQSAMASAFVDTSNRMTMRILGGSNKVQSMIPNNKEITAATAGMDFNKMFEYTQGLNYLSLIQNGKTYTPSITGHTGSGNVGTTIKLLNETNGGAYGSCVMCFCEILDSGDNVLGYFAPYKLDNGEIVMVNTYGITAQQILDIVENVSGAEMASRIFRPSVGYLMEVTQAEDDA